MLTSLPKVTTHCSGRTRVQSRHSASRSQALNPFAVLASHEVPGSHHGGHLHGGLETGASHLERRGVA